MRSGTNEGAEDMTIGDINREIKWAVASGNTSLAIYWARVRENYLRSKLDWRVKFKEQG